MQKRNILEIHHALPLKWMLFITYIFIFSFCNSQNQGVYYNFSKSDGLSEINIYGFVQDNNGFIYAATASGLYMHNGSKWQYIKSKVDNNIQNIGNYLNVIAYDKKMDIIYLSSATDLQTYDVKSGTFTRIKTPTDFFKNSIRGFNIHPEVGPIIATSNGIFTIDKDIVVPLSFSSSWPDIFRNKAINFIAIDENRIGVTTLNQFGIYNKKSGEFSTYKNSFDNYIYKGILDTKRNRIWFQSLFYIVYFDLTENKFKKQSNSEFLGECRDIILKDDSQLWVSSGSHFDLNKEKWVNNLYTDGKYTNAIQYWAKLFIDRENNLWTGSLGYGINLYTPNNQMIENIPFLKEGASEPISQKVVGDLLYITNTSNGNLYEFNLETKKDKLIKISKNSPLLDLEIDEQKNILYCQNLKEVFQYNLNTNKITTLDFTIGAENNLKGIQWLTLYKNYLIVSDHEKILKYNTSNNKKEVFPLGANFYGDIYSTYVDTIDKILYILGTQKVIKFNLVSNHLSEFLTPSDQNSNISTNNPAFIQRIKNNLWISSRFDGLYKYNLLTKQIKNFNKDNTLFPSNLTNRLETSKDGKLWVGFGEALILFDPETEKVVLKLDRQNGFKRDDTSYGIIANKDKIIKSNFGNIDIYTFPKLSNNNSNLNIALYSLVTKGKEKLKIPLMKDTSIVLSENQSSLKIGYSIPYYSNFNQNSFRYRLLPSDTTWKYSYDNSIEYQNLKPGKYTFELLATLSNGTEIKNIRKLNIKVNPLFYKTWWFILLSIMTIGFIIYSLYKLKVNQVRQEEKLKSTYEKQINELEMKALRAQMNPHFIFNSLNSIQKFIFEKDEYAASQYLTKFSRLIRLILDQSNQDFITIGNELEMLKYYIEMEQLRFNYKFEYKLIKEANVKEEWQIPSMVVQAHVENAIWHGLMHLNGGGGVLKIKFNYNDKEEKLLIIIEDNGIGRARAIELKSKQVLKKKSYGSKISEDRISNFNKLQGVDSGFEIVDLKDENGVARGTKVLLSLKLRSTKSS